MSLWWMSRFIYYYAECHYAECCYAECRYAECRDAPRAMPQIVASRTTVVNDRNMFIVQATDYKAIPFSVKIFIE
jgi:hypothetical protein